MSLSKYSNSFSSNKLFYKKLLFDILQKRQNKEQGFTLIELLVSMVILTIVVGMTGTGLVFVMSKNTSSDGEITQQANLRRALDFIGDEVRSSINITKTDLDPAWITGGLVFTGGTSPSPELYLQIPVSIEAPKIAPPDLVTDPANTLRIENHGLTVGNAVRFSFSGTSTSFATGTTYYVRTVPTKDTFTIGTTATATSDLIFTASTTPQNFSLLRLSVYYTVTSITATDKGVKSLYRATGQCSEGSNNCTLMIDSLTNASPFDVTLNGKQATLTLNGQLCNPPSMRNECVRTPALPEKPTNRTTVSMTAISRATAQ